MRSPTRRAAGLLMLGLAAPSPAQARRALYSFDQTGGRIGFTAEHLGMFSSNGRFERFQAELNMDPAAPSDARVAATIQTSHFALGLPGGGDMLRGERYFDVARHPTASFSGQGDGTEVGGVIPIRGRITLRGVERPWTLLARVAERQGQTVAFTATGDVRRSDFGMTPDATLISDLIRLTVQVTVTMED